MSAFEVTKAIEKGIKKVEERIEKVIVPMADDGDGTVQSLIDISDGQVIEAPAQDTLYRNIQPFYGIMCDGKTAVIEMAAASVLLLLKNECVIR